MCVCCCFLSQEFLPLALSQLLKKVNKPATKSLHMCLASSLVVGIFFFLKMLHAQHASSKKCCDPAPSVCFPECKLTVDRSSMYFLQQSILHVHVTTIKVSGVVSHAGINCFYHFHIWINYDYEVISQLRNKKCGFRTDQFLFCFCFIVGTI